MQGRMNKLAVAPYPVPYDIDVAYERPGRTPTAPQHPMRGKDMPRNNAMADMAWVNSVPQTTNYKKRAPIRARSVAKTGGLQQGSATSAVYQAAAAIRLAVIKALATGSGS